MEWNKHLLEGSRPEGRRGEGLSAYRRLACLRYLEDSIDRLFTSGDKVIDVGCGWGKIVLHMAGRGIQVVGVDTSGMALSRVAQQLRSKGLSSGHVCLADCRSLPFPDARFDGLVSFGLLEHFKDHPEVLRQWIALLKPGGRVLLEVPNGIRMDFLWHDVLESFTRERRWVWPRPTSRGWVSNILGYEERWWPSYFKRLAKDTGLSVTRSYSVYPARPLESVLLALGQMPRLSATRLKQLLPNTPPHFTGLLLVLEGKKD